MSWGYVAVAAATVVGSAYSANRAGAAARAGQHGADAATAETARQYDQTRADLSSGRSLYEGANSLLGQLYGIPIQSGQQFQDQQPLLVGDTELPKGTTFNDRGHGYYDVSFGGNQIGVLQPGGANGRFVPANGVDIEALRQQGRQAAPPPGGGTTGQPNMGGFFASPDYNFKRTEGQRDIQGTFAARGGAQSGNALRALTEFNSNLASGEFGNYFNRLTTLAGLGSAATGQTAAYGANAANQAGRNALIAGDARASGITDQANIIGQGVNQLGSIAGYYNQSRQQRPYGGTGAGGYGWSGPGNTRYG